MSQNQVMAPAIKLAHNGYVLEPGDVKILDTRSKDFDAHPAVRDVLVRNGYDDMLRELRHAELKKSVADLLDATVAFLLERPGTRLRCAPIRILLG